MSKIKVRNRLWITDLIANTTIELFARPSASFSAPVAAGFGLGSLLPPKPAGLGAFAMPTAGGPLAALGAPASLLLPAATFKTNVLGVANLKVGGLPSGRYLCTVTPEYASSDDVGPKTAATETPTGIYRSLSFDVNVRLGDVTLATPIERPEGTALQGIGEITVGLQPVWMKSPKHGGRAGRAIDLIVIHHTAVPTHSSIHTFMTDLSPHYMIDVDGQIVKFVQESQRALHAGYSQWAGVTDINFNSIGIEIVNIAEPYREEQYAALIGLLDRLLAANPQLPPRNIVGHSDIATVAAGIPKLGRKSSDPGMKFEWARLEKLGWGLLKGDAGAGPIYGGYFDQIAGGLLKNGDNDKKRRFGGVHQAKMELAPVEELQTDLAAIGYALPKPDGDFGAGTEAAVSLFQEHFFAGGRGHKKPDGKVDLLTAQLIKGVLSTEA